MTAIDVAKESLAFWKSVGAGDVQCWALLGSEDGETSFLPDQKGDKVQGEPTAFGIAQWHLPRIEAILKGTRIDVRTASHLDQLHAAHWEITQGSYRRVWPKLMAAETIVEAVTVLVRDFEQSGNQPRDIARRTQLALHWEATLSPLVSGASEV